jgi:hypothetical protein
MTRSLLRELHARAVKTKPPSQLPRPEGPIISVRVAEALAKAMWEIDPDRIRQLSGLPELSDELIQHRIDMLLKAGVPWLSFRGRGPQVTEAAPEVRRLAVCGRAGVGVRG